MALSPYNEKNSSVYRSRSSSFSSPTSRNFLYQEVFEIGGNALVRSFSCGQVFTKDESGQTIQATQVRISNFISPSKNLVKVKGENNSRSWSAPKKLSANWHGEKKPMKSKMSLQFADYEKPVETAADNDKSTPFKLSSPIWRNIKRTGYINLVVLTIFSAFYIYSYRFCNQDWDTQLTVNNLKESVFGQEEAISIIENVLIGFNNTADNAVMCFTGGIGVGKTFVSSLIYNNFPWAQNEYINFFDSKTEEMLRNKKCSKCGVNLIVIDGIDPLDSDKAVKCVEHLLNTQKAKFLVILIFRAHTIDEEQFVVKNIKKTNKNFYHIPFKNLKEEEVEQCIIAELKRQKKFITQKKMKELLSEQMKFCNISKSFHGCKNVLHEVSLLPMSV